LKMFKISRFFVNLIGVLFLYFAPHHHALRFNKELHLLMENKCGDEVQFDWIHPQTKELVHQGTVKDKFGHNINSFETHVFLVYRNGARTLEKNKDSATFKLGDLDTVAEIKNDEEGNLFVDVKTKKTMIASDVEIILNDCRRKLGNHETMWEVDADGEHFYLEEAVEGAGSIEIERDEKAQDALLECASKRVAELMQEQDREMTLLAEMHKDMRDRNRDYKCADLSLETTEHKRLRRWKGKQVKTVLDYDRAKIEVIDGFATEEQCAYLMEKAEPRLRQATVAGATLASTTDGRRAKQASVDFDWSDPTNPATKLAKKAFEFANSTTGYGLPLHGQEDFTVIKYDPTDEYKPHCDASCNGEEYRPAGRVATMVIYCEVPAKGGATTFDNVNQIVVPKKYDATFFSYLGPDNMWDDGLTLHSGCPIIEGEKWIATLWMRLGVSETNPWTKYDPLGNPAY